MDLAGGRKIDYSSGVQQAYATRPALFCMPLPPMLKRTREEYEARSVEAFAYFNNIGIGTEVTPSTVEVVPFLQRASFPRLSAPSIQSRQSPCLRRGKCLRRRRLPVWGGYGCLHGGGGVGVLGVGVSINNAYAVATIMGSLRDLSDVFGVSK